MGSLLLSCFLGYSCPLDIDYVYLFSSQKKYVYGDINSISTVNRQVVDEFMHGRFWALLLCDICFKGEEEDKEA